MRLTEQEQTEQDEAERVAELRRAASEPPKKRVALNRAERRRLGLRGRAPLAGAFRRPRTRPIRGIDPTPVSRPSFRLHGRTRYGVERDLAAVRSRAAQADALAQLARMTTTHGHPTIDDLKEQSA